jgi:hypothetical protein
MKFAKMAWAALVVALVMAVPATADARWLSTAKAKSVARSRVWNFDYRVQHVKVDWYVRWSRTAVHVSVTGSWTRSIYHSGCAYGYYEGCSADGWTEHADSNCDAVIYVRKNRYGHVSSRVHDKSCFYG